ncbi:hypothetical protein AB1Y20_005154 [Prymnesium parvum]|uniref:2-oxoglutarate dehydrogenase, mitochondrial n=1 Tax=Prymnesium parvum TaxID=97485 RepID=A0AB34J521_PRYPA
MPPLALRPALSRLSLRPLTRQPTLFSRALSSKPDAPPPPHPFESFLSGSSAGYIEDMYAAWQQSPESVHKSWQSVFARMDAGAKPGQSFIPPPNINAGATLKASAVPSGAVEMSNQPDQVRVMQLIQAYQVRGHNVANLDPLGLYDADLDGGTPPDLLIENYGFTEADLDKEFAIHNHLSGGFLGESSEPMKLRDIISRLQQIYTGTVGVEYMHIWNHEQVNWMREQIETPYQIEFTPAEKKRMLDRLSWSDHFEAFLATKYSTSKRFGLEGCESLIVGMKELMDASSDLGVENIVMGMPHRGRLNVLANVVRKPLEHIFSEFQERFPPPFPIAPPLRADPYAKHLAREHRSTLHVTAYQHHEMTFPQQHPYPPPSSQPRACAPLSRAHPTPPHQALPPRHTTTISFALHLSPRTHTKQVSHSLRLNLTKPATLAAQGIQTNTDFNDDFSGSGDVKYHLGMSYTRPTLSGKTLHMSLVANPSHLEAVNPVVEGKTRAKQHYSGDHTRDRSMAVLLHGDAAFSGQGVVFETMGLSDLHDYSTGGTVHIVVNNQIGFTTDPYSSRSSPYCTDVAKAIQAPIFHVNGDDVEAVARVCRLAAMWRQRFHRDVVIDIVCYRKYGHNELDQPMFTQPMMYTAIAKQKSILAQYTEKLIAEGVVTADDAKNLSSMVNKELEKSLEASRTFKPQKGDWLSSNWSGLLPPNVEAKMLTTGVDPEILTKVGTAITNLPEGFTAHRMIAKIYGARAEMIKTGKGIDWAVAEQLAWGTLMLEGNHVRISGQDVERGTFSHRHAVLHDQKKFGDKYRPLANIDSAQAEFSACNSSLSEFGVLGFELGFSLENPRSLIMWEAQFGDFANTAQCMIDQFICCGEQKWLRQSGLVMLLPHGFEGQGPEHSSARLERFLQLCDDDEDVFPDTSGRQSRIQFANWQIVNITTPANYFHVLRRQVLREFRKPLVVMSPKSLLRHRLVKSDIEEFASGTRFQRYLPDVTTELTSDDKVRKLILCSGKVYYDLLAAREAKEINDIAIARVEQISPFPSDMVQKDIVKYPNAEVVWCQEEPKNAGAWSYARPRIVTASRSVRPVQPVYVGRGPSAAASTGSANQSAKELQKFLDEAFA